MKQEEYLILDRILQQRAENMTVYTKSVCFIYIFQANCWTPSVHLKPRLGSSVVNRLGHILLLNPGWEPEKT